VAKQVAPAVLDVPMGRHRDQERSDIRASPNSVSGRSPRAWREAVYDASLLARLSLTPAGLAPVVAAEQAETDQAGAGCTGAVAPLPPVAGRLRHRGRRRPWSDRG